MVDPADHAALQAKYDKAVRIIERMKADIGQKVAELAEERDTSAELLGAVQMLQAAKAESDKRADELTSALQAAEATMGDLHKQLEEARAAPAAGQQQAA